jgi:hypothetical protein
MKPYVPSPEAAAPALVIVPKQYISGRWRYVVETAPLRMCRTREEAEEHALTVANAIADDVHGAELADLRARIEKATAIAEHTATNAGHEDPAIGVDMIIAALKGPA